MKNPAASPKAKDVARYLLSSARPYHTRLVIGFSLIGIQYCLIVASAYSIGEMAEKGFLDHQTAQLIYWAEIFVGCQLGALLAGIQGKASLFRATAAVLFDIRCGLFQKLHELPLCFYDRARSGDILTRLNSDIENLESFFSDVFSRISGTMISLGFVIAASLAMSFHSGVCLLIGVAPAIIFAVTIRHSLRKAGACSARLNGELGGHVVELTRAQTTIHGDGLLEWSKAKIYDAVTTLALASRELAGIYAWVDPVLEVLVYVPCLIVLSVLGPQVISGVLTIGFFITYIRISQQIVGPVQSLCIESQTIQSALISAGRIAELMSMPSEEKLSAATPMPVKSRPEKLVEQPVLRKGQIVYRDVHMAYNDHEAVLKGVSFSILPGQWVGVMGRTGAGKTTLMNLLLGLYEFQSGDIFLDGTSIREFPKEYLRRQIGYLSHETAWFGGSLLDNLTLGEPSSAEMIERVLRLSCFDSVMKKKKISLLSRERGIHSLLTLGELQLLSMARLMLRNPAILILDEINLGLDPQCYSRLTQALFSLKKGRTCLMISHRIEDVEECDLLLEVVKGRVNIREGKTAGARKQKVVQ